MNLIATSSAAAVASGVLTTTDANTTGLDITRGLQVRGGTLPAGTFISEALTASGTTHTWQLANDTGAAILDNETFPLTVFAVGAGASLGAGFNQQSSVSLAGKVW
jgi:hypothetical protein